VRIGIDYTAAINQTGGVGRFVRHLVHALTEIDHQNQYVLVHAAPNPGRAADLPVAPNVTTRQLRFQERVLATLWHRLRIPFPVDLATGPVDIFHAPDFVLPPVRHGITIMTVHDLAFLIHPECAHERLRVFLERAVPASVQRADYIIADSESTRNDLICLLDASPDRVFVVPGGVDPAFAPATEGEVAEVRRTYRLDRPYLLTVGVIEPRKNLPRLIEAYTRFRVRTGLPHQLVIAGGRGWLSDETFRQAEGCSFPGDVRFTGHVPDPDLVALYSGAEAFAYPSLYEGFGLPVLEAMACATAVVCSNVSSLPEFATDAAILVQPTDPDAIADALETVCCDAQVRHELSRRGRERAQSYSWGRSAQRLLEIYERVMRAEG
jgi:glycosyltransferase involved in cell wall biosynthesis